VPEPAAPEPPHQEPADETPTFEVKTPPFAQGLQDGEYYVFFDIDQIGNTIDESVFIKLADGTILTYPENYIKEIPEIIL
jgi:hypothetical protein